jgi:hypothetical protein
MNTSLLPFTSKPNSDNMASTANSRGLYNTFTQPILALFWPQLTLSLLRTLLHSQGLYMTCSGSIQTFSCLHSRDLYTCICTFMATTSTLPMACISPCDFYKHYLMTSTHSHGFYNNLTASFGILSGPMSLSWPVFASSWPLLALLWPLVHCHGLFWNFQ